MNSRIPHLIKFGYHLIGPQIRPQSVQSEEGHTIGRIQRDVLNPELLQPMPEIRHRPETQMLTGKHYPLYRKLPER